MSCYSEVGLVLRNEETYNTYCKYFIENNIDANNWHVPNDAEIFDNDGQFLLVWNDVNHFGPDAEIVKALKNINCGDYLLVEACYDYPSDGITLGLFEDNLFNLRKVLTVSLSYKE